MSSSKPLLSESSSHPSSRSSRSNSKKEKYQLSEHSSDLEPEKVQESEAKTRDLKPQLIKSGKAPITLDFNLSDQADQSQSDSSYKDSEEESQSERKKVSDFDHSSSSGNLRPTRKSTRRKHRNESDDEGAYSSSCASKSESKLKKGRKSTRRSKNGESENESGYSAAPEDQQISPEDQAAKTREAEENVNQQQIDPNTGCEEVPSSRADSRTSQASQVSVVGVLLLHHEGNEAEGIVTLHSPRGKIPTGSYFPSADCVSRSPEPTQVTMNIPDRHESSSFPLDENDESSSIQKDGDDESLSDSMSPLSSSTDGSYSYLDGRQSEDKENQSDYPHSKMTQLREFPADPDFMDTENEPSLLDADTHRDQLYAELENNPRTDNKSAACLLL
ncbi:hypothetical protein TRFO_12932 [Tritrichomonas foetus]|uniref:Uncharacterized protein n=1 Tax=Tritrichomonas foetus TaxID=1144522 RepID=A0A1J4L4G9_9EUKA|nr:hypothetical protein TRFO_12932 [Tritrichomonas foetus]|eukprot:OHT16838.1 hypothetical protein TRFO_12932 [Tritrichomonas foetus]